MSGTEGTHFLQVPSLLTKSMDYHYPAEFIVPTNFEFNIGPIGNTFETEFEHAEVPVGLQLEDLSKGLLVMSGDSTQRFLLNMKLIYQTVLSMRNYVIITRNREWRRLLDLIPEAALFRLGTDFTLNPLDTETCEVTTHGKLIAQVFTQTFYLSRLGSEKILESIVTLLGENQTSPDFDSLKVNIEGKISEPRGFANSELGVVSQFLFNIGRGPLSLMLGTTDVSVKQILEGITIIEVCLEDHQEIQFIILTLIAKILSHCQSTGYRGAILVDEADLLTPKDPHSFKAKDVEQHLLEWVQRFKDLGVGLHFSINTPSRFPSALLNLFQTRIAFQTTTFDDLKIARDLLQLLPDRIVHSQDKRHDNYQLEFLKTLKYDKIILKRSDIPNPFPVQLNFPNLGHTHIWTQEEIQNRLRVFFPDWRTPTHIPRTALERDFPSNLKIIQKILSILSEYPELGRNGLLSSLNSDTEISLEMNELDRLLIRLVNLNYILPNEWDDGRGHKHTSYQLKDKGRRVYEEYLDEVLNRVNQLGRNSTLS